MERFVFREELEERHLEQRIRKTLKIQKLAGIEEICRDAGVPDGKARTLLNAMIERREVERLRPLRYEKDDMDFFRLSELQRPFGVSAWNRRLLDNRRGWLARIQRNLKPPVLGRGFRQIKSLT